MTDGHIHLYPPEADFDPAAWAKARGEAHWALLCTRRRKDGRRVQTLPTLDALMRQLDAAGVARAILLGWYWENPETCREQNRFYASCVKAFPDRLSAFATFHPSAGMDATLAEIRWAHENGFKGLGELSPHAQHFPVYDPVFATAMDLAGERGLLVNLHVTDPDSARYPGWVETPLADFTALARTHPRTRFILAHWGGLLPLRDASALALTNIWYDTAASPLLYREDIWRRFFAAVSRDRVLFGSDYPLNLYPRIDAEPRMDRLIAEAHRSGLGADDLAALMRDTAAGLFFPADLSARSGLR